MRPVVSVICPTFNRSTAIVPTIRSVLQQDLPDWELLVMSDGSTDDTEQIVRDMATDDDRIRVVPLPRTGHPSGSRTEGLRRSRGRLIAYLDHDDSWRPDHLSTVARLLDDGGVLAATGYVVTDDHGVPHRCSHTLDLAWHPELQILDPMFEPSRFAHRRGLPESVGGWRRTRGLEDWDLLYRLTRAGHRFRTSTQRTVTIFEGPRTRRRSMPPGHLVPVMAGTDAQAVKRAFDAVEPASADGRMRAAQRRDDRERHARLRASGQLVEPVGPRYRHPAAHDARDGPRLCMVPAAGGYVVALPLYCSTEEHASRIRSLFAVHAAAQLDLLAEIVDELGLSDHVRVRTGRRSA